MELKAIKSSNIQAVGYVPKTSTLTVQFKGGKTYNYADVPEKIYNQFKSADSPGNFFHVNIKGVFQSTIAGMK